jgi:hypothetical protein
MIHDYLLQAYKGHTLQNVKIAPQINPRLAKFILLIEILFLHKQYRLYEKQNHKV